MGKVVEFYGQGRSVFVTGATGFLGKGLVSKILRAVPDVGKIYVLVRPKKGVDPLERVKDILAKDPILGKDAPDSQLKRDISSSLNHRLIPIVGDILLPGLGISPADRETLTRDVHVIFHLAAMVSFKPDPQTYLEAHVRAIADLLNLSRDCKQLMSFVHVSTAFTNAELEDVRETIYPTAHDPRMLLQALSWMDSSMFASLYKQLLGNKINVYAWSKALAENYIAHEARGLPVVIVRPSIVCAARSDPCPGWVDGIQGPVLEAIAAGRGLLRTTLCDGQQIVDLVPVDAAINCILVAGWKTAIKTAQHTELTETPELKREDSQQTLKNMANSEPGETEPADSKGIDAEKVPADKELDVEKTFTAIPVYTCSSGTVNPITWDEYHKFLNKELASGTCKKMGKRVRSFQNIKIRHEGWRYKLEDLFRHKVYGKLIDTLILRKPTLMKFYDIWDSVKYDFYAVTMCTAKFHNDNTRQLAEDLDDNDREIFPMNLEDLEWSEHIPLYIKGIAQFVAR